MKILKKSKIALLMFALFLAVSVAGVWAYYGKEMVFENPFYTANPKIGIVEVFDPTDNWVPGEEKQKEVQIQNEGNVDMLMRFKVGVSVKLDGEDWDIPDDAGEPLVEVGWNSNYVKNNFWTENSDYDKINTWYYYNDVMSQNDITENVINSVKFADWAGNEYQPIEIKNDKGEVIERKSVYEIHVVVTTEMVQANQDMNELTEWPNCKVTDDSVTWTVKPAVNP